MKSNILIGIGGGTGSGKTSLAKNILKKFGTREVVVIEQDNYYQDLSHIPLPEREKHNFDHPNAIDFKLLKNHLSKLLKGQSVNIPIYNFETHTRFKDSRIIEPHNAIVLEGILVLTDPELREMMDIKIYIETDDVIRFIRRLTRDIEERGRTPKEVIRQYLDTVKPMHEQFVEKSMKYADIIIPEGGDNSVAIDLIQTKIRSLLQEVRKH
jgi:uridine kinase